jgi:glycosyltransferase involved in cell wall biosynthesis
VVERDARQDAALIDELSPLTCLETDGLAGALTRIRAFHPDVCWVHGLDDTRLEGSLLTLAPCILTAHGYYGTCATGAKRFSFPAWQPCSRRLGLACIPLTYARRCGGLDPAANWRMFRRQRTRGSVLRRYRRVLVASRHMLGEMLRHRVAADRAAVIPLPLTDVTPLPAPPSGTDPAGPIVFLGRLTPEKGAAHLLEAASRAGAELGRRARIIIVGDGPELQRLRRDAARLALAAEFPGWLEGVIRFGPLSGAALAAVPSLWPEPWGLAGIEAGALGVPAVGYAVGGIAEWLVPGETGELAPSPPRVEGLAAAMVRALADRSHHAHLSRGAWQSATRFTMDRHVPALEAELARAAAAE